jgi:histidine transport system substrate-binding protein
MLSMRKRLGVLLFSLCATTLPRPRSGKRSASASSPNTPFESVADGSLQGFDIDLGNAICEAAGQVHWVHNEFDGMIPALRAQVRRHHVVHGRHPGTPEADRLHQPPVPQPHLGDRAQVRLRRHPESLKGKQVGVLQGSLQEAYARAHLAKLGAQIKAYQSQDQNYADLQNGRLDATLTDKLEAQLNFLSKPEGADFKTGPAFKDPTLPLDIAMGLRKNDQDLRA